MTQMGIDALKNNLSNPGRAYLWEVLFAAPIGGDTNTLLVRCQSTQIPDRDYQDIHIPYKQTGGIQYPGKLTYSHHWDCTFVEGEDRAIFDAIYEWQNRIVNDYTGIGSTNIKRDVYLHLIDVNGHVSQRIRMIGCYLKTKPAVALAMSSEERITYSVTFSYDSWEYV